MTRFFYLFCVLTLCACAGKVQQSTSEAEQIPEQFIATPEDGTPYAQICNPDPTFIQSLVAHIESQGSAWARGIEESLLYVRSRPDQDQVFPLAGISCSWAQLGETLEYFQRVLPQLARDPLILERDFFWYKMRPDFLVTGYYEPELKGSLEPNPGYPIPIWGLPPTLRTVDLGKFHPRWQGETLVYQEGGTEIIPFYTRHAIDGQGALETMQKPIAWARDAVDVFFLHIQGSGRLCLPDGQTVHVLYAGKNGHEYVSLGKTMMDQGLLTPDKMSMQSIRDYLSKHPKQMRALLDSNPSYVFFRMAEKGPLGAMGRILTPMVSVATDAKFLPLGTLLALDTTLPCQDTGRPQETALLTLAQDRGGAIKKARLDLFCGAGARAEFLAGHLKAPGHVFLLLKK